MRRLACSKFQRLSLQARDRSLTESESCFVGAHRKSCVACLATERETVCALDLLTSTRYEVVVDDAFNARVLRMVKVTSGKDSWAYWSPAVVGAAIACVALIASLQLISKTSDSHRVDVSVSEAHRVKTTYSGQALELSDVAPIR